MKTEAFNCVYYLCPDCNHPNTIRLSLEHQTNGLFGTCCKCHESYSMMDIEKFHFKTYGFLKVPKTVINYAGVEFICDDCGLTNIILANKFEVKDEQIMDQDPAESWKDEPQVLWNVHSEMWEEPKNGKCVCGIEYELEYPFPEWAKKLLEEGEQ